MDIRQSIDRLVERIPEAGCWIWMKAVGSHGYGMLTHRTKNETAHRAAYRAFKGPIPKGMCVLHRCDVRSCVNPDHLFLGTLNDNNQDMVKKGRHARGESHPQFGSCRSGTLSYNAKLTEHEVHEIRSSKLSDRKLARLYGVSRGAVQHVRLRNTWKHI